MCFKVLLRHVREIKLALCPSEKYDNQEIELDPRAVGEKVSGLEAVLLSHLAQKMDL